ncbi:IS1 family transposase, partial [Escherichia coli]
MFVHFRADDDVTARLFYAYDRLRKTVVAHVFGERTLATL